MKGYNQIMLLVLMSFIIGLIILIVMTKQFGLLSYEDIILITEKHTHTILSTMILVSTMEQDVRIYEVNENFDIKLDNTNLELKYVGAVRGLIYDAKDPYIFTVKHHLNNIVDVEITTEPDRICISKKINNCIPELTICEEGEACCTIQPNDCKYIN